MAARLAVKTGRGDARIERGSRPVWAHQFAASSSGSQVEARIFFFRRGWLFATILLHTSGRYHVVDQAQKLTEWKDECTDLVDDILYVKLNVESGFYEWYLATGRWIAFIPAKDMGSSGRPWSMETLAGELAVIGSAVAAPVTDARGEWSPSWSGPFTTNAEIGGGGWTHRSRRPPKNMHRVLASDAQRASKSALKVTASTWKNGESKLQTKSQIPSNQRNKGNIVPSFQAL